MPATSLGPAALKTLAGSALVRGLSSDAVAEVVAAARPFSIQADAVLFREGRPAEATYLPLSGAVKLQQTSQDGHNVVLRVVSPGEPLGLVATLEGSTYPATAVGVGAGGGVRWTGKVLHDLMDAHPRIALNILPVLVGRLHEMQGQFRELATERVERRLARVIIRLARQTGRKVGDGIRIGMPLGRQDLAEMAGTTLFSASRILRRWEGLDLIRSSRKQVIVRAPHLLVAIAEDLPGTEEST